MDLLAEIEALERRVATLVGAVPEGFAPRSEAFVRATVAALLAALEEAGDEAVAALAASKRGELEAFVERALQGVQGSLSAEIARTVTTNVAELVHASEAFYEAQGVNVSGLRERVRRAEDARRVADVLTLGHDAAAGTLRRESADAIRDAIAAGHVDRKELAERIETRATTSARNAATEAQAAVSAYNQVYRNELAADANLDQWLYYGTLASNTRPFCRVHLNRVFSTAQIDAMDNGMLNPVSVYKGGWRCRHAWLPVDAEWDDDLKARVVPADAEAREVAVSDVRNITIVATPGATNRLKRQIALGGQGYEEFADTPHNDVGFVAVHREWRRTYLRFDPKHPRRVDMEGELAAGHGLARNGDEALFTPLARNHVGGDVDVVWNGRPTDVKTPDPTNAGALNRPLKGGRQSDFYVVSLTAPLAHPEESHRRLRDWLVSSPGKRVWVLHRYDNDRLEEVTP